MSNSVEGFITAGWNQLATQALQSTHLHDAGTDLPAIAPGSAAWSAFKQSPEQRAAYSSQLNTAVNNIQLFLGQYASPGLQRQQAIGRLSDFLHTRVNCHPDKLSPLVINESRRNLKLFAQQLNNPNISAAKKLACALTLAEGLGVCNEGETLNILQSTQNLCSQQSGLAGVLTRTKNSLVEQHLQQLVKHEDKHQFNQKLAQELEIHHVQALKNHVAEQWGLCVVEDRYATADYQMRTGPMAEELLRLTITPMTLASAVAEEIAQYFCNLTGNGLSKGMSTEQLKTEPLRRAIEAEFGQGIELEHCLEFNEDYTSVKLRPLNEIALHVLHNCQSIGLIEPHADLAALLKHPLRDLHTSIQQVSSLRGAASHAIKTPLLPNFWLGFTQLIMADTKQKEEENRSKTIRTAIRQSHIQT